MTMVDKDNRFVVHLPWLEDHPPLHDNFNLALKRLGNTVRKLKEENLYDDCNQIFEEWAREGIIEEVPKHEIHLLAHYLPHRHVVKENSKTRIRPVFDASAKVKASPFLNDCLEKGINLVELIPTLLTRFRMNKFGVTTGIRKAFLQIRLKENDKDFLRFLWYNEKNELKYFRHCLVVFGICRSPFLLNSVIQYNLEMILEEAQMGNSKYPAGVVEKLKNSLYVDIDLAGSLFLRDNKKSWACLFTCAVYRAVHIELVTSLYTQSFLLALRRFIARRGRCSIIYCENGSNFVDALIC
ncbi:uncharacterized protein LOC129962334 [Argiope bruennichi]|uniref:uncharacterized protein LOC129962334 n=1 Tax=Argiope bruennichi TaxID=94029 RepID=UPI0024954AA1|nr:uncharacterized protein LOC129962334 [Argiope bruennichi]